MRTWTLANIAGVIIYLLLASMTWNQEAVPLLFRTSKDLYAWLTFCLPILVLYAALNLVWMVVILARIRRPKTWLSLVILLLLVMLWTAAFKYDHYRFYHESAPISKGELEALEREGAESAREAKEEIERAQAKGRKPLRTDSSGGRYYSRDEK